MKLDELVKEIFGWNSSILKKDTSVKIRAIERYLEDFHSRIMEDIDDNSAQETKLSRKASTTYNSIKERLDIIKSELTSDDLRDSNNFSERVNKINKRLNFSNKHINLYLKNLEQLPNNLPKEIGGSFDCSYNKLTSLEGSPIKVGEYFDCYNNELTSLKGCPNKIGEWFNCRDNKNLSQKAIVEGLKNVTIKGKIYTDYGTFDSYKELVEKLSK